MAYEERIQTQGIRIWYCRCGAVSKHSVRYMSHRLRCPSCDRVIMVGSIIFDVTREPAPKPPWDSAIPHSPGSLGAAIPSTANGIHPEPTVRGGMWRSAEPVTIGMPSELNELWRDKLSGELYMARSVAMATRWICQPLNGTVEDRYCVSRVEWRERMEKVG